MTRTTFAWMNCASTVTFRTIEGCSLDSLMHALPLFFCFWLSNWVHREHGLFRKVKSSYLCNLSKNSCDIQISLSLLPLSSTPLSLSPLPLSLLPPFPHSPYKLKKLTGVTSGEGCCRVPSHFTFQIFACVWEPDQFRTRIILYTTLYYGSCTTDREL